MFFLITNSPNFKTTNILRFTAFAIVEVNVNNNVNQNIHILAQNKKCCGRETVKQLKLRVILF